MYVDVERPDPAVAVIRLNRPERMNAMSFDVMVPFRDALDEPGADASVRAVVVTGAGRGVLLRRRPGVGRHAAGRRGTAAAGVRTAGDAACSRTSC